MPEMRAEGGSFLAGAGSLVNCRFAPFRLLQRARVEVVGAARGEADEDAARRPPLVATRHDAQRRPDLPLVGAVEGADAVAGLDPAARLRSYTSHGLLLSHLVLLVLGVPLPPVAAASEKERDFVDAGRRLPVKP